MRFGQRCTVWAEIVVSVDDQMDRTSSMLIHYERPEYAKSATVLHRPDSLSLFLDSLENPLSEMNLEESLFSSQQEDLSKRRASLMVELVSTQNATGKVENRVQRMENSSLVVNLLGNSGKNNNTSFVKIRKFVGGKISS
ncbi:unnamed protein product [Cercopithifilaria johnstoni]|uniref:Uncharacterized protein n=1 Tax=Cercopithifilaria johnstoni TaxID=2874296 RepID=A0A8J2Q8M1_9BILA|nr:unnamed protein product [Cercopithifilaria johnstoni]